MLDFLYLNGWGAMLMVLFLFIPFLIIFVYVVYKKSTGQGSADSASSGLSTVEWVWMALVLVVFVGENVISISYMPTVQTARAAVDEANIQQVNITAGSWFYDISTPLLINGSNRTVEVGPVRFSGKSSDTMHSFAIYSPDGDVLFTMMLMPGLKGPTSIVYTFDKPGTYTVRCLEYCGINHHNMRDQLIVVAGNN